MIRKIFFCVILLSLLSITSGICQETKIDKRAKTIVAVITPELINWDYSPDEDYGEIIGNIFKGLNAYILIDVKKSNNVYSGTKDSNINTGIKEIMKNTGKQLKSDIVVYGSISKDERGYNIQMQILDIKTGLEEYNYSKRSPLKSQIPLYLEEFTVEAVRKFSDIKSTKILLKSLLVPGLGQFQAGHKIRGLLIFAGMTGLIGTITAMTNGDPYDPPNNLFTFDSANEGLAYFWGERRISRSEYDAEAMVRYEASNSRRDATKRKKYVIVAASFFYFYNIIDAMLVSKAYNQKVYHNRYALYVNPDPSVTFTIRF